VSVAIFEKDAIISGLGISRIGRRTGIPGLELTLDAARDAIADAGLNLSDIDGIATLGDVPRAEVTTGLGIEAANQSSGFDTGGVISPVMSAMLAVAEGRARHVLVYRTVQMLGGSMLGGGAPMEPSVLTNPPATQARVHRRHR
jgi:hypothetical protein